LAEKGGKGMSMVYRLNANELNNQFMDALRILFKDKEIEIIVNEVDETAYLFKSEANRQTLLQAIQNIEAQQNLVQVTLDGPA
jgi:antitoxin YefM